MKTYDKLNKQEKEKVNTYLLFLLPYILTLNNLLLIYVIVMITSGVLICFSLFNFIFLFFGLILLGGGLLLWLSCRIFTRKYKELLKKYFKIESEKELFKD